MRYVFGVLGIIAIIITFIVLLATFKPSSNGTPNNAPTAKLADLSDDGVIAKITIDGPINAEEFHRQIQLTVSASTRQIDVYRGYEGTVIANKTIANNERAFKAFLAALDRSGFSLTRKTTFASEAGLCSTTNRYIVELYNVPKESSLKGFRRWITVCNGQVGSFGGSLTTTRALFRSQFPGYSTVLTNGTATSIDF